MVSKKMKINLKINELKENEKILTVPAIITMEGVQNNFYKPKKEIIKAFDSFQSLHVCDSHPDSGIVTSQTHIIGYTSEKELIEIKKNYKDKEYKIPAIKVNLNIEKEKAENVVEEIKANKRTDNSVGYICTETEKKGNFLGKEFIGIESDIVLNHDAILKPNEKGACSAEDGCTLNENTLIEMNKLMEVDYVNKKQTEVIADTNTNVNITTENPPMKFHIIDLSDESFDDYKFDECQRKEEGKCIGARYGIKDNKSEITSLWFNTDTWTEEEAKNYCKDQGTFLATEKKETKKEDNITTENEVKKDMTENKECDHVEVIEKQNIELSELKKQNEELKTKLNKYEQVEKESLIKELSELMKTEKDEYKDMTIDELSFRINITKDQIAKLKANESKFIEKQNKPKKLGMRHINGEWV